MKLKSLKLFIFFILLTSCATSKKNSDIIKFKKEFKKNQLSLQTYLNLVKQSYIKGCITGMNLIKKEKTHGKRLDDCRDFSEKHIIGIKQILIAK